MATITFEGYFGTPAWSDMGANRLVFSSSLTSLSSSIVAGAFNGGTHLGTGVPGTDQCGATHMRNVKFLTYNTMSVNGAASETLNDTNLANTECTFRVHFNDAGGYSLQNGVIYTFDGADAAVPATGVDACMYVKGEGDTAWQTINSDSIVGPTLTNMDFELASIGGIASGYTLNGRSAAVDHHFYCALSVSPETAGGKSNFAIGAYFEFY
jgi:hypothetical protein